MLAQRFKLLTLQLFTVALFVYPDWAQGQPEALQEGIEIRQVLEVGKNYIRIAKNPTTGEIFYLGINGLLFSVDVETGSNERLYSWPDHGVRTATGFAVGPDGTFYLVGNPVVDGNNIGLIVRGKMVDDERVWSTVAESEPYAESTGRDHKFNAIELSLDGQYLLVNSGSRTDHGEEQNDGREHPITSAIFRIPIDSEDLVLPNDEAGLAPYLYADGVRNSFDMAFAPNGDLFAAENSDTRDNPEELNWIRPGHHYGFPWRIAAEDTPQRFADFDPPDSDNLLVVGINMENSFHNDPDYPPPPDGVVFSDPVISSGPDADKYRDPADGLIKDASDEGVQISTFTPHSSPLGVVFDTEFALQEEWAGDGFCLSQNDADLRKYTPFGDPGEDLLHLELSKNADGSNYQVQITRLVRGFTSPVDAVMKGNKIYVLEYARNVDGSIWEITLPPGPTNTAVGETAATPDAFAVDANYPNPFNASTVISYTLPSSGQVSLRIFDAQGQTVRKLLNAQQPAGRYSITWDGRDNKGAQVGSGPYFAEVSWDNQRKIEKMLLLQ
ncbi:MAG: T9SS type A sorting domain-containing protein [Candidatus Latescibacteria bacterium]|nr:T9SS type A sorting domain-containing protein [Candidatus Latescibacterota bacterium]